MQQFHGSDEYIASDELIRSVNIAASFFGKLVLADRHRTLKIE